MLDGSPESALYWVSSLKENFAMVFDNADTLSPAELEAYFPPGQRGNILITSRNSTMQCLVSPENSLEVTGMEESEAVLLLLRAGCLNSSSMDLKAEASKIVKELCCLPLAIDQAGAFIASGATNIGDYLNKYLHNRETLLSHSEFTGASKYNKSVYGTWELSYKEIQKRAGSNDFHKARAADSALFLLALFPFLHHESISEEIFSYAATQKKKTISHPDLPLSHSILDYKLLSVNKDGTWDNFIFKEGVRVLLSFCLIKKTSSDNVHSMHPLVHAWGIDRMTVNERQKWSLMALATLSACIENNESQLYGFRRSLVTHVRKSIQYTNTYFDDTYEKFGRLLNEQGYSSEAEEMEIQVLNTRKKILGQEHPNTTFIMGNLACTYSDRGKYTEAEKLFIQVLDVRKKNLGEEHPATILTMGNLASTYGKLGKYTEAEKLKIHILDARKKTLGEEHPDTILAMGNLACTFSDLGKYTEAEKLAIQVLDDKKKILGEEHPDTMLAMGNLACTYNNQGKYTEAEKLEIQVLDIKRKFLGEEHPATMLAMGNLACTFSHLGKYTEAEKLEIQVLDDKKKILGEEHPDTLLAMEHLACTYSDLGKYTEAKKLFIQVVDARNKILGGEHPDTICTMRSLATIQKAMGQSMKVDNVDNEVFNTSHKVSVTQEVEGENVYTGVPHADNRVLGGGDSDAVCATAHLPSVTNVHDRMIHSQKKGICQPATCFYPFFMLNFQGHLFSHIGNRISNFKSQLLLGIHKKKDLPAHS
jgi:tetratricopeptide (TPR) repeat protein